MENLSIFIRKKKINCCCLCTLQRTMCLRVMWVKVRPLLYQHDHYPQKKNHFLVKVFHVQQGKYRIQQKSISHQKSKSVIRLIFCIFCKQWRNTLWRDQDRMCLRFRPYGSISEIRRDRIGKAFHIESRCCPGLSTWNVHFSPLSLPKSGVCMKHRGFDLLHSQS